jgi:DNA (cytosine-5)-methyltransferase 1
MMTKRENERMIAVDLFSGCGGLSLGLEQAGFDVVGAVEIDALAAATYEANHDGKVIRADICDITAKQLRDLSPTGRVDLLSGCAPCQGFCSLTNKQDRDDPRNELLFELGRLIGGLRPTAIFMENVPGLLTRGRKIFESFLDRLRALGYQYIFKVVQMADFGIPQYRRRLVLLAGKGFRLPFPIARYARVPRTKSVKPWRTLRDAIYGRPFPHRMNELLKDVGPESVDWHVVRTLQPQTMARLKAATPGLTWLTVDEALRPKCHTGAYSGFTNVYQRMVWDRVSPTITSGCTTPAKGRFGHPDRRRTTISVREAALIQTFPCNYEFATSKIDAVCEMIGNAVPPRFARAIGRTLYRALAAR